MNQHPHKFVQRNGISVRAQENYQIFSRYTPYEATTIMCSDRNGEVEIIN